MEKAFSYIRVSGLGQRDGDGPTRQRHAVAAYAKRAGVEVIKEHADLGVSGTAMLAERPGLRDCLAAAQSTGVKVILVERADRLARDLVVGELILAEFRAAGVRVLDANGNDLTVPGDDPTAIMLRQVLGSFAEYERRALVAKLAAARARERVKNGRCEGRKPYGDRPGEAEVVERMRELRRKPKGKPRLSFAAIAAKLNEEGRPTRTGKPWHPEVVRRIIEAA